MRSPKTIRALQKGLSSTEIGWDKPLAEEIQQLEAEVAGLMAQLANPTKPNKPASYVGHRMFQPEPRSFALDTDQDGVSSNLVNYVVRDGQDYTIPVAFSGPGVFVAEYLQVQVRQRFFVPAAAQPFWYPVSTNINYHMVAGEQPWTTKFMVYPQQPFGAQANSAIGAFDSALREMNYFWNLTDSKSGRMLSNDLIPHLALLPRLPPMLLRPGGAFPTGIATSLRDGGFFRFRAPWLLERDAQAKFTFRPVTPVLQFDSSISGTAAAIGLPYDDREQGVRNQSVVVQVELHGARFETAQDALRAGAVTTR